MRKILRRLRKGIKTACLTALLATCWQVGQPAQVSAATETVQFSGTVSPAVNDLSHLFLIYATGVSSWIDDYGAVKLGDFPLGQTTVFSVLSDIPYTWNLYWYTAGLYGDVSSGQYIAGENGVTLGINGTEGDSWSSYFSVSEETVFNYLLNDDVESLPSHWASWNGWHVDYDCWLETAGTSILFDFSQASSNGEIYLESQIVPEPTTIVLLGAGGLFVLYRRRKE